MNMCSVLLNEIDEFIYLYLISFIYIIFGRDNFMDATVLLDVTNTIELIPRKI